MFAAVVRLTPTVKTDCVTVIPTIPRPNIGNISARESRLSGSNRRRTSHISNPATVKRTAANSNGGTGPTAYFTATKLVPKKNAVRSRENSAKSTARLPSDFEAATSTVARPFAS